MNLNVIAVDAHGKPIDDLTEDEFGVIDPGRLQEIAFFQHNDSKLWEPLGSGPNQFSNRRRVNVPYAAVILFDMLNESFASRGFART